MPTTERVIVTLPTEVVRDMDRLEKSRSKFILEAVRHEVDLKAGTPVRWILGEGWVEAGQ